MHEEYGQTDLENKDKATIVSNNQMSLTLNFRI